MRDATLILKEIGPNKIRLIKEVRQAFDLDLRRAKDLVEMAPVELGTLPIEAARAFLAAVEGTAARVELIAPRFEAGAVRLEGYPSNRKISVVKAIREATQLGLRDAKALSEAIPNALIEASTEGRREALAAELERLGCRFEVIEPTPEEEPAPEAPLEAPPRLILQAFPPARKIAVIKVVRRLVGGLREAKELAEAAPVELPGVAPGELDLVAEELRGLGAVVTLESCDGEAGFRLLIGDADRFRVAEALCSALGLSTSEARRILETPEPRLGAMTPEVAERLATTLRGMGAEIAP